MSGSGTGLPVWSRENVDLGLRNRGLDSEYEVQCRRYHR